MIPRLSTRLIGCTCRTSRSSTITILPKLVSNSRSSSSSSSSNPSTPVQLPWFISTPTPPSPSSSASSNPSPRLATSPLPRPPPAHLPTLLHPLHAHLTVSPFLDHGSISYINARECDPEGAWCEWVVVCSLRKGREGGLRGCIEGVRSFLAKSPITLSPSPPSSSFAPPSTSPLIAGLPTAPSKHARGRAPSPSRSEQMSGWAMLDAGEVVVHFMTVDAREEWGIEGLWEGIRRESLRSGMIGESSDSGLEKEEIELQEKESENDIEEHEEEGQDEFEPIDDSEFEEMERKREEEEDRQEELRIDREGRR